MFSTTTLTPNGCVPPNYFAPMLEHSKCFTQSEVSGLEPATQSIVKVLPPKWRLCRPRSHIGWIITSIVLERLTTATKSGMACGGLKPKSVIMGYFASRSNHQDLLSQSHQVTSQTAPEMIPLIQTNTARLQVEPVNVFIVPSRQLNAYTFGMDSPKAIVLYSSLFKIMDSDEIQFILGHEMGHVKLGHTWLNTLVGGIAGIPSSLDAAAIMELAFRWWNRACEYSADRAGLLACGKPNKAISALVKLEAGSVARTQAGMQAVIQHIESEDDDIMHNLEELISSHPMIAKRIIEIRSYSNTQAYSHLRSMMDRNLTV